MSVATDIGNVEIETMEASASASNTIKLDITNNWTGMDELPFEPVAERVLEMEAEENAIMHRAPLSVTFGKPVHLEGKGWACPFRMSAMGRVHVSPARGVDAVDALQAAFDMAHKQLTGMSRMHTITFLGGNYLAFRHLGGELAAKPAGGGCPVMNGSMSI